ncbi:MAG: hypothetical protein K2H16_06155 [Prevotella sp.]|nr:hypothetical protein [Prevotella sp.]MDE6152011.1 hypothetical protein [Prevotella sp.]
MGKFLNYDGVVRLWRGIRLLFDSCITRIFWDSSSEMYMYDTMGESDKDFPIQAVNGTSTRPGLMTPEDKKTAEYYKPRFNRYIEVVTKDKLPIYAADYISLGHINDGFDLENPEYQSFDIRAATTSTAGVMSAHDKQILNDTASFGKSTVNPAASHPFMFDYCDMMDVDIVMTVGDMNLWCVTVLLNDTEDQTYLATYKGQVLARKRYTYQYTNMPQGDITTWFIPLPVTATAGSCYIGIS